MPKIRPRPRAYAFAGVYVLLAVLFAALSHRVLLGLMVAVPLTGVLALNYYLVRSAWARQLGDRARRRMAVTFWGIQTTLLVGEVMVARRVPLWLGAPFTVVCAALAATGYVLWSSREGPAGKADAELAAADARVVAESETAERTRVDRPYAAAITHLEQVVARRRRLPGGKFLLHSHRAQYLTFQAGLTAERLGQAVPAERGKLTDRMRQLYGETESELRAAIAAPPGPGRSAAREYAALGLLLCVGAEQGGPDRTQEGVGLLREALVRDPSMTPDARTRIQLDLATALVIRDRLHGSAGDRQDAEALLSLLIRPGPPVAGEARKLRAELTSH
jgi:hypothetical protein